MYNLTQRRSEAFDKCLDWICENIYEFLGRFRLSLWFKSTVRNERAM